MPEARQSWFGEWWAFLRAHRAAATLTSGLVLIPCFWQRFIQAGDFSSHLYNAWLATLVADGRAPGLVIVRQWTNVLVDLALAFLVRHLGPWPAEHLVGAVAVLLFFWSAFALCWTVHRRPVWFLCPMLAVFTYGWVFHAGFFNFYVATSLSLLCFAILWRNHPGDRLFVPPLMLLAAMAHPLPVAWLAGAAAYVLIARHLPPTGRLILTGGSVAMVIAARLVLSSHFVIDWSPKQLLSSTGIDQVIIYGRKDYVLGVCLAGLWALAVASLARSRERIGDGMLLQLYALSAAAVFLLPEGVLTAPAEGSWLNFVATRMSLISAVLLCTLLGYARPGRVLRAAFVVFALLRFTLLFADTRELNRIEGMATQLVSDLPADQRVLLSLDWPAAGDRDQHWVYQIDRQIERLIGHMPGGTAAMGAFGRSRIPWATWHIVDRACLGRCFSYGNYEPASGHFRLRAIRPNSIVTASARDALAIGGGYYVVKPADVPLYLISQCSTASLTLCLRPLKAGDRNQF